MLSDPDLSMMTKLHGSCLCGKVRFELTEAPTKFYSCHCRRCRKITGSSNAANLFAPSGSIRWVQGEESITSFVLSSETFFNAAFCSGCGSPVPRHARSGDFMIIPAGCLDDEPPLAPQRTIFWNDRASWFEPACRAQRFANYDSPIEVQDREGNGV
jgi:hypothetical protein